MAGLLSRLRDGIGVALGRTQVSRGNGMRRFDAAVADRLTASWLATNNAIDQELRQDLDRLRARSRDLFKNNEYAAKFGRLVRNNVVGPEGFTLYARATRADGTPDTADNTAIQNAFWDWCSPRNCDVRGRSHFNDICRAAIVSMARDGEFLIQKVRNVGRYGFRLQALNVDRLDTKLNRAPSQGSNAIIMGVEVDENRRPLYYHIWTSAPSVNVEARRERKRIPADEIYHGYIPLEEEQTRGVPWMHAAMRILNDLKGYREAAVIAARLGASKMGIWETPDGSPPPGSESDEGYAKHPGEYVTEADPGHFDFAPAGYKLHTYDPTYPHDQFGDFCRAALRGISSAWGVSYHGLANDLTDVSFSSIRSGVMDERDEWMVLQNVLINQLLTPVYDDWLDMALMRGAILGVGGNALPASRSDKFRAHVWQGRRWGWVDPMKDIQAAILAIEHGLASPQQIAMQAGRDVEEILDDIAAFQRMVVDKGVVLGKPVPMASAPPDKDE